MTQAVPNQEALENSLAEFHAAAARDPELWRGRRRAQQALSAAFELRDVGHELVLRRLHGVPRAPTFLPRPDHDGPVAGDAPGSSPDLPSSEEVRAYVAREEWTLAIDQLRSSSPPGAAKHLARNDHQRAGLLRWLLKTLAEIQPEAAQSIEDDWAHLRSDREKSESEPGHAPSLLSRPGRLERWEWEMIDRLTIFLEPMLPL